MPGLAYVAPSLARSELLAARRTQPCQQLLARRLSPSGTNSLQQLPMQYYARTIHAPNPAALVQTSSDPSIQVGGHPVGRLAGKVNAIAPSRFPGLLLFCQFLLFLVSSLSCSRPVNVVSPEGRTV